MPSRRSHSLSPRRPSREVAPRPSRSVPLGTILSAKRTYDKAFPEEDDDDIFFDPTIDQIMDEYMFLWRRRKTVFCPRSPLRVVVG